MCEFHVLSLVFGWGNKAVEDIRDIQDIQDRASLVYIWWSDVEDGC